MISSFWLLNVRGTPLVSRDYRGDVAPSALANFIRRVITGDDEAACGYSTPIFEINSVVYAYISTPQHYFVATSSRDSNCFVMIEFLNQFNNVLTSYFDKITDEVIRDNLSLVYELLDEVLDYGYPQTMESTVLKEYITGKNYGALADRANAKKREEVTAAPPAVTGIVSWRKEGIKYRKNEVFLDVLEDVTMVINQEGRTLSGFIKGAMKMQSHLSGMPQLKLGLNERVRFDSAFADNTTPNSQEQKKKDNIDLEDIKLHQCVSLNKFEQDRSITFIPPDGDSQLMGYRINTSDMKTIIMCTVQETNARGSGINFIVKLTTNFRERNIAKDIVVRVPVPSDADSPEFNTNTGIAKYKPALQCVEWNIKQLPGKQTVTLQASFGLPTCRVETEDVMAYTKKPITVSFQMPYFSLSGIQVRYLKIHDKSGYEATPWVRYFASGNLTIKRN